MKRTLGSLGCALLVLVGCANLGIERACTSIGSLGGVGVVVVQEIAPDVDNLRLKVCWAGDCRQLPVDLRPGSISVDEGCQGSGPDAACSATAVPDGTSTGFVEIADLPEGPITVSASGVHDGHQVHWAATTVVTELTYPNGPDCGAGARQAVVTVAAEGLR